MELRGRVHKFGNDINTDYIISAKYKAKMTDLEEMSKHLMEDLDPAFYSKIKVGDFIAAGANFGCGSSREAAPLVIKKAGIGAVLAKSFARIFFRNGINIGLPLLECNTDLISPSDSLVIDLEKNKVMNLSTDTRIELTPLPKIMIAILAEGGLENYFKAHPKYTWFRECP